jgi:hypothetical protein
MNLCERLNAEIEQLEERIATCELTQCQFKTQ